MKMKFLSIQLLMLLGSITYAQVGIGTTNPTRTLHVEGKLQLRETVDKLKDNAYNKVLVVNDIGNIDYTTIEALQPDNLPLSDPKIVINNYYDTDKEQPIDSEIITCGKFQFAFITVIKPSNTIDAYVRFRLTTPSTENIEIYTTFEQNYSTDGFQFQASDEPRVITPQNTFIDVPIETGQQGRIANNEFNLLYLSYPKDNGFYRVSFYRTRQDILTRWITTCEKF